MDHSIVSKTKQSRVSRRKVKAQGTRLHQAYLPQYWARNYRFTSNLLVHLKTDIGTYIFFLPFRSILICPTWPWIVSIFHPVFAHPI